MRARKTVRRLFRVAGVALVLLCGFYAVFGGAYGLPRLIELKAEVSAVENERNVLRQQVDSLFALRDSLRYDPATIEREARERYGLIRPGETIYRFVAEGGADWTSVLGVPSEID